MAETKKVTISLPIETVERLESAVPAGQRSRFIDQLIQDKLAEQERQKLRALMVECCQVMYEDNLQIEEEFHSLEEEVERLA